jgi:tetratricopeptide (TPR) repeat protein
MLLLPFASAYADSFTVTANKDLYVAGEMAIIVGILPSEAPQGYAVLLRVMGPDGSECAVQNVLPDSDSSFVSRPLNLDQCGSGEYTVLAFYSDLSTNSTFAVSNSTQIDSGNRLELRLLKNVAVKAQETVNAKLREFLDTNQVLPEQIADKYSLGVFEASLVFQAIDFGNTAEAKKHLIFAIKNFREVLDSLSAQRVFFGQAIELDTASESADEELVEKYQRLKEFYFRLEELAQKNGIENENEFGLIVSLLARSKALIDEGNLEEAGIGLQQVNGRLEAIRQQLYGEASNAGGNGTGVNSTRSDDLQAKRLSNVADRFERDAYILLEGDPGESLNATAHRALQLISLARLDIEKGDYTSARGHLSEAFSAIDEAKEMKKRDAGKSDEDKGSSQGKDEDDGGGNNPNSGGQGGGNSGSGSDEDDQ